MDPPGRHADPEHAARRIVEAAGPDIRLALPLGLGKPVALVNALTRLVAEDERLGLTIHTALTLERPDPSGTLARRLLLPARDRLFGACPGLDYARWLREGRLPDNIAVHEFFLLAGRWLGVAAAQQGYIPANYSHALDLLARKRPNALAQLVAPMEDGFSLSCNTDITADLLAMRRRGEIDFLLAVELNDALPPMGGEAAMPAAEAQIVCAPATPSEPFSAVREPVSDTEHAIGLHVSRLVRDGGTLQIGIGALGDAVAQALLLRQRGGIGALWETCPFARADAFAESGPFRKGLYAVTEMLAEGLLRLFEAGVVRREADGAAIHAAFFVETRDFRRRLREMAPDRRSRIAMTPVSFTNALYGREAEKRAARRDARFVNTAMQMTLLGEAVSDTLEDGQVVSGVGGQFDFVEQAFALEGARSILALPATRTRRGRTVSNIVWSAQHATVPRHMRDIVVTEYGIADLRGRSDADAIAAMLEIADARFQQELLARARRAGKIGAAHRISEAARRNRPGSVRRWLRPFRGGALPDFPFGTDFTAVERQLLPALARLREAGGSVRALAPILRAGLAPASESEKACLARLQLASPAGLRDRALAIALRGALRRAARDGAA